VFLFLCLHSSTCAAILFNKICMYVCKLDSKPSITNNLLIRLSDSNVCLHRCICCMYWNAPSYHCWDCNTNHRCRLLNACSHNNVHNSKFNVFSGGLLKFFCHNFVPNPTLFFMLSFLQNSMPKRWADWQLENMPPSTSTDG